MSKKIFVEQTDGPPKPKFVVYKVESSGTHNSVKPYIGTECRECDLIDYMRLGNVVVISRIKRY